MTVAPSATAAPVDRSGSRASCPAMSRSASAAETRSPAGSDPTRPMTVEAAPAAVAATAAFTAVPPARMITSACTREPADGNSAQMTSTITSPTATKRMRDSADSAAAYERDDLVDVRRCEQLCCALGSERGDESLDQISGLAVRRRCGLVVPELVRDFAEDSSGLPACRWTDQLVREGDGGTEGLQGLVAAPELRERLPQDLQRTGFVLSPLRAACDLDRTLRPLGC